MREPWHPSDNELAAFVEAGKSSANFDVHVNQCNRCQQILLQLQRQLQQERIIATKSTVDDEAHKLSVMKHAIREGKKLKSPSDLRAGTGTDPKAQWGFFASLGTVLGGLTSIPSASPTPVLGGHCPGDSSSEQDSNSDHQDRSADPETSNEGILDRDTPTAAGPPPDSLLLDVMEYTEDLSISMPEDSELPHDLSHEEPDEPLSH